MAKMNKDERAQFGGRNEEWDPMATVGNNELSGWQVDANHCWIQVRGLPMIRKVRRNKDCRKVAYSVAGGVMETFEIRRTLPWVAEYLNRLLEKSDPAKNLSIS